MRAWVTSIAAAACLATVGAVGAGADDRATMSSMSIVGVDPDTSDVGVALASKFFAVGPIATFVRADVGAVAVMGGGPFKEGERLLDWLAEGLTPAQALARLRGLYPDTGQINVVTMRGDSVSTTGPKAAQWKGHRFGPRYAAAGNILAGPQVVEAFGDSFEGSEPLKLPLAERLLRALEAADAAGGDARGRQGAALKVYRKGAGFAGTDLLVDLRVDDSAEAVADLRGLWTEWALHHLHGVGYQPIEQAQGGDVAQVQRHLRTLGYLVPGDRAVFDERGEPRGVFNDATAAAVVRWKREHGLDTGPYLVPFMLRQLEEAARTGRKGKPTP